MTTEKRYKLLTRGDVGILKGTEVDKVDGSVKYVLDIVGDFGVMEQRKVAQSTFRRWWRLVEDDTLEGQEEEVTSTEEDTPVEQEVQPTIEDLKNFNDAGGELSEEELETFKKLTQIETSKVQQEPVTQPKRSTRKAELSELATYFLHLAGQKGAEWQLYTEGREGVIKAKGKAVIFFGFVKNGVRIYLKEEIDSVMNCPYLVEEKQTYPKQYPFRILIPEIDDESAEFLNNILDLYI